MEERQLSNTILAHMAEFGLVGPIGRMGLQGLVAISATRPTSGFRRARGSA